MFCFPPQPEARGLYRRYPKLFSFLVARYWTKIFKQFSEEVQTERMGGATEAAVSYGTNLLFIFTAILRYCDPEVAVWPQAARALARRAEEVGESRLLPA
jgi:hypothetical protein